MNKDETIALFVQLGRLEEKLDVLNEMKPRVELNTKFRIFATAFVIVFVGMVGFAYKAEKVFAKPITPTTITKVIK